jgi:glycolate oxidase FAD binding subunit
MASPSRHGDALVALRAAVGEAHARPAGPGDSIDGVLPALVVEPGTAAEVAAVLADAHGLGLTVVPRGSGTKLDWGAPPRRADVVLDTRRLDRVVEHAAGDLVATAQAGVRLDALQGVLAASGQRLALDPPEPGATLGGIVAAGASGPRRHRFGTARDLLIGVRVVLADGTAARSGGKVVKNVAGYDLGKLFAGSLGTLGVVVEATFRLHPRPAAARLVRCRVDSAEAADEAVRVLLASSLEPSAVELRWAAAGDPGGGLLAVLFETSPRAADAQAEAAAALLRGTVLAGADLEAEWERTTAVPFAGTDLGLKISALPSDLAIVLDAVDTAAAARSLTARVAGRAGAAVLSVGVSDGDDEARAGFLEALRQRLLPRGAHVVVVRAAPDLKRRLDVWGPVAALPLMRRVKARFDPDSTLSPGRFVGGL